VNVVSPPLAQGVAAAIAAGDVHGAELANNPGWAIGRGTRHLPKGAFAEYLEQLNPATLKTLRLGKKMDALFAEAESLHKQVEQYAYGPPAFRFTQEDVDQARAAGVLIEFEHGRGHGHTAPVITDRAVYRELAKHVIPRTVEELRARLAAKGKRKTAAGTAAAKAQRTPREELDIEHRANLREFTRQAHLVNLDLGAALLKDLAVSPDDPNVARFFAWGLLGPESSGYLGTSDHTARTIAANGVRLVVEEHRTTTTPKLKSGKPGKTKVAYGEVDDAAKWLWKFVAGAKTAADIYSRALVVFAAQHYASQLVLPTSQRRGSVLPCSHKDTARKAFEQITKDVLPASYLALQRAIAAEARSYHKQADALTASARQKPAAATKAPHDLEDAADAPLDEDQAGDEYPLEDQGGEDPGEELGDIDA
ncbi:MAG: hypothetical protein QOG86_1364, partial [Thermoleophilaceae bacterium]|nr:hypothetical protein [Thermoleophilaceae bacterium]